MTEVTFKVDGVDGEFYCDADEVRSYKTSKQLARGDEQPAGVFDVMERIFMGEDEAYIERVGGSIEDMNKLVNAAIEACKAKNSSTSPQTSNGTGAK